MIQHPAVVESAVVAACDKDGLFKPKAFVVLGEGYEPISEMVKELQDFVKSGIASYNYLRWVEFVEDLPKTATGKIQCFKLRYEQPTAALHHSCALAQCTFIT